MATLIAVYNSEGCVGRCDARCYDAAEAHCDCICKGKNHGAGLQVARENTRLLADTWLDDVRRNNPGAALEFDVPAAQGELFILV